MIIETRRDSAARFKHGVKIMTHKTTIANRRIIEFDGERYFVVTIRTSDETHVDDICAQLIHDIVASNNIDRLYDIGQSFTLGSNVVCHGKTYPVTFKVIIYKSPNFN